MELNNIQKDNRGSIDSITGKELTSSSEITLFATKASMARGGCIHNEREEHLVVIEGIIQYIYRDNYLFKKIMGPGMAITIKPNVPHYFISITDSVVAEWGPSLEEKQTKYEEFRKIVLEINRNSEIIPNRNIIFPKEPGEQKYC